MELTHIPFNRLHPLQDGGVHLKDACWQDHEALTGALAALELASSGTADELWQTLRNVCARLLFTLRGHIQREAQLEARPSMDHYGDYRYLQVITRYVTLEDRPFLLNSRYQLLIDFLQGLRRHINEQETELLPDATFVAAYTAREAVWNK